MSSLYTFNEYIAQRKYEGRPVNGERPLFHRYTAHLLRYCTRAVWDRRYAAFEASVPVEALHQAEDARDERATMADALV